MYGMVNKAVEELVCSRFGVDKWEQIRREAKVDEEVFISDESYPDEITYRLVGAACKVLGAKAEDVLHLFGEHWVLNTARQGYGALLDAGGKTLPDFLANLPKFHSRVSLILPKLRPPEFAVTDRTADSLHLHYRSEREGLQAFVVGLLHGLGKMFNTAVTVKLLPRVGGVEHDIFHVSWKAAA